MLLLSMGFWQLERSAQKKVLFEQFNSNSEQIISLAEALERQSSLYTQVEISGQFLQDIHYLLDNMVNSESIPGRHVVSLFQTIDNELILINRGWIALRSVNEPQSSLVRFLQTPENQIQLSGRLDNLRQPGLSLSTEIPQTDYPKTVQFPTFEQFESDLGKKLVHYQLLLNPDNDQKAYNFAYLREWQPREMGPERHLAYAFQWFALALTLCIIYLLLSFRKIKDNAQY